MDKHNAFGLDSDVPAVEDPHFLDGARSDELVLIVIALQSIEDSWYFADQSVSIQSRQKCLAYVRDHFRVC